MATPTPEINGHWQEIKGDIKKTWVKLSEDELEKTKGDVKQITVLLNSKYAEAKDTNGKKLTDIFKRFEDKKNSTVEKSQTTKPV